MSSPPDNRPGRGPAREPDLDALLGAYVLDALDVVERAQVEEYLERNSGARAEVDELRETAATLALAPVADQAAPTELWDRISASIAGDARPAGDDAPDELATRRTRRSTRATRWATVLAVAAAVIAIVLAAQVVSLHRQLDDTKNPGGRAVALAGPDGREVAHVTVAADGSGHLVNDHLAPLPADRTYQLWAMMGDPQHPNVVSAGVLGPDPRTVSFKAAGPLHGLAITVETAGGVPSSTQTPVARASVA